MKNHFKKLKSDKMIKLFEPSISNREIKSVTNVLKTGFWASGSGIHNVEKFEHKFSKYIGSKDCVAVNSGSAALHLALSIFNLKNKEVLVPSLTFLSTVHSIVQNNAKPIFVEIDPSTMCISVEDIKNKITTKTGAILPVHFGGMPANLSEIKQIANQYKIPVIEDAAHASGSTYQRKKIGTHSEAVCFSFHPVKNLGMPTGGAICLNLSNVKKSKKILNAKRWCGIENRDGFNYDCKRIGWNNYMNEISAVIGVEQLLKLDKMNNIRKNIAKKFHSKINIENKMPFLESCSYHLYWILVKNRSEFMKKMQNNGIETGIHYKPVHKMTFYSQKNKKLPITEQIGKQIVTIPIHPNLKENDIFKIISCVNKFSK
jgi:perosamine synthetase